MELFAKSTDVSIFSYYVSSTYEATYPEAIHMYLTVTHTNLVVRVIRVNVIITVIDRKSNTFTKFRLDINLVSHSFT